MNHSSITTEIVTLTPELAREWLDANKSNRTLAESTVLSYSKAIQRGEWVMNGEPVIFFSDGTLGNGQHRCHAVVRANIPIQTMVVRGVENTAFKTIDGGRKRTAADVLGISGELHTTKLASAARAYMAYSLTGRDLQCITSKQIEDCVNSHPELRYWIKKFCANKFPAAFPASLCGYMTIASEKYGVAKLDQLMDQLSSGVNLAEGSPALVLRERILSQTTVSKLSKPIINAFIIKTINAHLAGKSLKFLRHTELEQFPKIE